MVQFNFSERTIKAKVVYYGPPQSGKTTNLEQIHRITDPGGANRLISLNTAQDRTLFFDLLPFSLGTVSGYDFKVQLYTVPGQVQYNATRRVVLAGADAVVFVADSQKTMARENQASFENMKVNLLANRLVPEKLPLVLQYNKQDLDGLTSRAELDRVLNFWGRRAFPAVASRGEGVIETFSAVVQDMLTAIAVKYNLREKGLDPAAVPEIVAQAFAALLRDVPVVPTAGVALSAAPVQASANRVIIAQPTGVEPAHPGQLAPEASPVSEELLHRAIRSNVDLAEMLGQLARELTLGLATIQAQTDALGSTVPAARQAATAIRGEVARLRKTLQELGRGLPPAGGASAGAVRSEGWPESRVPAASPQRAPAPPAVTRPAVAAARPTPAAVPPLPTGATLIAGSATTLDALILELAAALRPPLGLREITIENEITPGTPLPRCSPASLRRALVAFLQGLGVLVEPASTISARAARKPVLLRGRDGGEVKRDFLMLSLTHRGGLEEADQQRILQGADRSAVGEGLRLLREMGGFLRFAPLPGGALETRLFLPV